MAGLDTTLSSNLDQSIKTFFSVAGAKTSSHPVLTILRIGTSPPGGPFSLLGGRDASAPDESRLFRPSRSDN